MLAVVGCASDADELLNSQFDFFVGDSQVVLLPGGSPAEVSVRVVTGELVESDDCTWAAENLPTGVAADLSDASGCEDFVLSLSANPMAAPGPREITLVGTASYDATSGILGDSNEPVVEERTRTLTVEVTPTFVIRIVEPASGLTTTEDAVELAVEVNEPFNVVEEISWSVNGGPAQLFCSGGCNPSTPGGTTYTADEVVSLVPGENLLEVQARNSIDQMVEDSVTVTYQPVVPGTARWDGEAGDNLWTTGLNWDSNTVPGPGDDVIIDDPSATVRFDVPDEAVIRSLALDAGSLTLERGELRIQEASTVSGDLALALAPGPGLIPVLSPPESLAISGSLACSDSGRFEGGTVTISESGQARLDACILSGTEFVNAGSTTLVSVLALDSDASIENEASGSLRLEDMTVGCESTCTGSLVNAGTLVVTGFLATFLVPFENSGTADLQSSVVSFDSIVNEGAITSSVASVSLDGDWTNEVGSSVEVPSVGVSGDESVVVRGAWDVEDLQIGTGAEVRLTTSATLEPAEEVEVSGGTLVLEPNVELESDMVSLLSGRIEVGAGGILYARSRLRWSTGVLTGAGSTRVISELATGPTPTLLWDGNDDRTLDGHRLLAVAETFWSGGDVLAGNGAEFNNSLSGAQARTGLVRVRSDNAFLGEALGGVIATWLNQGVIRKEVGAGETLIDGCYQAPTGGQIIEDSGTVRVQVRCSP